MKESRIKRLWRYYAPHAAPNKYAGITILIAYGLGTIGASVLAPLVYREIIDVISLADNRVEAFDVLLPILGILGIVILFYNIAFRVADYSYTYFFVRVQKRLMDDVFHRVTNHSYRFFTNAFTGGLVAKAGRYVSAFESLLDRIVFSVLMSGFGLVGSLIVLFFVAPYVGIIYLIWVILYMAITTFLMRRKIKYDLADSEASSKVTARFSDVVTNILNLKMFASRKSESVSFDDTTTDQQEKQLKAWYFHNFINAFQGVFLMILEFSAMVTAIWMWKEGQISTGTVVLVQIYMARVFLDMWGLANAFTKASQAISSAHEMVEVFEEPLEVTDPEHPEKVAIKDGAIAFDNVSFGYHEKSAVLNNFSLSIKPGEKVGLVGASGSGKTTITKLLLRFLDIQKGVISIDGQDITKIAQDDLRRNIAYVPQDPILFHRSLRENIAYGRPDASEEEIIDAAEKAHAHEFINAAPEKYETFVGERGIKLSGGERQRVAIARAMIKDAPILVLDEATSSLDTISEGHIQEALGELMENRTTIVIAHRLSTIQQMDRIVVMDESGIAEEGTHDELLAKKGAYYTFWNQQTNGFICA